MKYSSEHSGGKTVSHCWLPLGRLKALPKQPSTVADCQPLNHVLGGATCGRLCALLFCIVLYAQSAQAASWYVDKNATGSSTGTSWANAWNELSGVVWGATGVKGGDTLFISGGTPSTTYTSRLLVGASGSEGLPITIRIGQDPGHNGRVIISPITAYHSPITIADKSYIVISGEVGNAGTPSIQCSATATGASGVLIQGTTSHYKLSYLDVTGGVYCGLYVEAYDYAVDGEIDHCYFHDNWNDEARILTKNTSAGTQFSILKFHDNDIYNFHMDAVKIALNGVDFYNNKIHDRGIYHSDNNEHPDGLQIWSNYLRVFGNRFYNMTRTDDPNVNSYIRYNPVPPEQTTPHDVQIYNNLFFETRIPITGELHRGVELSIGRTGILSASNFLLANNTFVGIPFFGLFLGFGTLGTANVSNIVIVNNIFRDIARSGFGTAVLLLNDGNGTVTYGSVGDASDVIVDYNSVSTSSDNFTTNLGFQHMGGGNVSTDYNSYIAAHDIERHGSYGDPGIGSAYMPTSLASACVDKGYSLSNFFTIDIDGLSRPQGTMWDIGAYEFNHSSMKSPTLRLVH